METSNLEKLLAELAVTPKEPYVAPKILIRDINKLTQSGSGAGLESDGGPWLS